MASANLQAAAQPTTITPAQFGRRYGVGVMKVLHWLNTGELTGIDVSLGRKLKPRWRIRQVDIELFEARRANSASITNGRVPARERLAKEPRRPEGFVQFFPEK
jgi:hypothetical protein